MRKKLSIILSLLLVCTLSLANPVSVLAKETSSDVYLRNATEVIQIEDITYTFEYSYENGNRITIITSDYDDSVEMVVYNTEEETILYNRSTMNDELSRGIARASSSGWQLISSTAHEITWAEGAGIAAVLAAIATGVGSIGGLAVLGAMGIGALSAIAGTTPGGILYVKVYQMQILFQPTHYLYEWKFKASTGQMYGPYKYQPQVYFE